MLSCLIVFISASSLLKSPAENSEIPVTFIRASIFEPEYFVLTSDIFCPATKPCSLAGNHKP